MKILIDAMGGDNAPQAPVLGALEAVKLWNINVALVGQEDAIRAALKEAGKKIPEEVSIVGVGDSWVDEVSIPSLTTARLFFRQCGEEAAALMLDMINGGFGNMDSRTIRLRYMIMERNSV